VGVGKISSSLPVNLTKIPKIIIQKFSAKISARISRKKGPQRRTLNRCGKGDGVGKSGGVDRAKARAEELKQKAAAKAAEAGTQLDSAKAERTWQAVPALAVSIKDNNRALRGVIPLEGISNGMQHKARLIIQQQDRNRRL
jgi:hypothetical protein